MNNESDKINQKLKWLKNIFCFDDRSFQYLFWFFSLLTIPIFAYLYSLPMTVLLWLIAGMFGLSEESVDMLIKFGIVLCFCAGFATQFQIWKMYKNKKTTINQTNK